MSTLKVDALDSLSAGAIVSNQNIQFAAGKGPDSGSTYLPLSVGGTEYARISGGDLAVGLTAPLERLHVQEETDYQIRASFNAGNYAQFGYEGINKVGGDFILAVGGNDVLIVDSANNFIGLGDGNNSPKGLLDLLQANLDKGYRGGSSFSDSTRKYIGYMGNHYTNTEKPVMGIYIDSQASVNEVNVGGGSSAVNAATKISFWTADNNTTDTGTVRFIIGSAGNVIVGTGALSTSATDGFLYIPTCAGVPSGTPTSQTGRSPLIIDSTNNRLYFYSSGSWRNAGP